MRNLFTKGAMVIVIAFMALPGCNKSKDSEQAPSTLERDITDILIKAASAMANQDVFTGNPEAGLYMLDNGIAPDFIIDETDLDGTDSLRAHIRDHSIIAWLRGISLDESQKTEVRRELGFYSNCSKQASARARTIYKDLENAFQTKYKRIYEAFATGSITREKFNILVSDLRTLFKQELRSLQLKEKLDEAFTRCFRKFLIGLHSTLTEQQWNDFVSCCKRN